MADRDHAARLVKAAPPLSNQETAAVNAIFPAYAFRRSKTRELWMTCCRKHEQLPVYSRQTPSEQSIMRELHQREPRNIFDGETKPAAVCPYCGTPVIVKELGRTGTRKNLSRYRRAVVLRWYRGCLWARAYDCGKHYSGGYSLTGGPKMQLVGIYRFRPGLAEETSGSWYDNEEFRYYEVQNGPLTGGRWNIHSPFSCNAEYGMGFDVVGMEEIEKSPFQYCMAAEYEKHCGYFLEFLTACCFYPRQIEMLMKAGMRDVVRDLAARGVKNAMAIDWTRENPMQAFGLDKQELRAFLNTNRDIDILTLYKRLKGRVSMETAADWIQRGVDMRETFHQAKVWNLPPERLIRYLARETEGHLGNAIRHWKDYLTAAQAMGYPLHRENVLLPKGLDAAHNSAVQKYQNKLEMERKAEAAEKKRLAALAYQDRKKELEKRYGYEAMGYVIRVPTDEDEIIAEGQALKHCVAGYANRHMRGEVTILFMRKKRSLDKPWLTIEMDGKHLKQIHGYKNEGVYSAKGRFAPDPRKEYQNFLNPWLSWVAAGSKRDRAGAPVLPRKKNQMEVKSA